MPSAELIMKNISKKPANLMKIDNNTFLKLMLEEGHSEDDYNNLVDKMKTITT